MATAKRKQEEQADQMDSDSEDSENISNDFPTPSFKHDFPSFAMS